MEHKGYPVIVISYKSNISSFLQRNSLIETRDKILKTV